jgi:hypothetical protein
VVDGDGVLGVFDVTTLSVAVGVGVTVMVAVGEPQPLQKSRLSPPHPTIDVVATTAIATDHIRTRMAAGYRASSGESR